MKLDKLYVTYYNSPIGIIEIKGTEKSIQSIMFVESRCLEEDNPVLTDCRNQLDEYFNGNRKKFELDLAFNGTGFQKLVWSELMKIPYGKTVTYKDIAVSIGNENAVRAVGSANGKNVLAIVVPCHRVIGSDGKLTGYAGRLWRKKWLINHEKNNI